MSVLSAFAGLTDPRIARTRRYPLGDLLLITLCGLLCGADSLVSICRWATFHKEWLQSRLNIVDIPSHDTLGRVLAKLDKEQLAQALVDWNHQLWQAVKKDRDVVAFDGKRIKGAADNLNLVTAWASRVQLTLGLVDGGKGAGEQEAMRTLLQLVDVKGCLVTADAMHTQTRTAQAVIDQGADYLLQVKANQGVAYEGAKAVFKAVQAKEKKASSSCLQRQNNRGVREERFCWTSTDVGLVDPWNKWQGLRTVVCVKRDVYKEEVLTFSQTRYFLSSAAGTACEFLRATKAHWGIENSQHWRLDVFFREDDCRVRTGNAATNLATLRRLALSLVKQETTEKVGVQIKRQMASWSTDYLETLLATEPNI